MSSLTTGQVMADSLIAHGVDTVFGIPGAHMYDFNDALAQRGQQLRFITTRHEQGAAYMAFGYAKSTGRVGVYTVVPGPGLLNSGAALCTARSEEHTSELQSHSDLVCRLLLEKKKK